MVAAALVAGCLVAIVAPPASAQAPPTAPPVGTITVEARGAIDGPTDIVAGEDGEYWFTSTLNDLIGRVSADGEVTTYSDALVTAPTEITMGSDGKLWFINDPDPATVVGESVVSVTLSDSGPPVFDDVALDADVDNPQGIAAGPNNSIWYTNAGPVPAVNDDGSIGRILPGALGTYVVDVFDTADIGFDISTPTGIIEGPDGNMWYADPEEDVIGRITPSLVPTYASIAGTTDATELAVGGDGRVWFISPATNSVGRVTITPGAPPTYTVSLNIAPVTSPNDITGGPDGNLWVTASSGAPVPDSVVQVTPAGTTTAYALPGIDTPLGITASPDEDELWFANSGGDSIGRLTTDGELDLFTGANVDGPMDVAVTPDGSVWSTNAGNRTISRIMSDGTTASYIVPASTVDVFPVAVPGLLGGVAAAPDGNVWFTIAETIAGDDGGVGRVTPAGDVDIWVSAAGPPPPAPPSTVAFDNPVGITVDLDGNVWVTDQGATPSIDTFTPGTDDAPSSASTVAVATVGASITAGPDGNVWFTRTDSAIGRLTSVGGLASFTIANPAARITTGWDGYLWFTVPLSDAVGRMSTAGDVILITDAVGTDNIDDPLGIAAGPQGDIWFVNTATVAAGVPPAPVHPSIGRIVAAVDEPELATDYAVTHYPTTPAGLTDPEEITAGTDGGMWFTSNTDDAIGRIQAATAPEPPDNVTAVAGNGEVTVTWEAPEDTGGMPVTQYVVMSDPGGETCELVIDPEDPPDELSCTVEGLTNGQAYTFTVVAITGAGTSDESEPSDPVTPATIPGAPTGVSATPGNEAATVTWTAPEDDGGAPVTGYTVTSDPGAQTCTVTVDPVDPDPEPLSCTVSGLTNGTPYTFQVTATNAVGTGPESEPSEPVTPGAVPDPPTDVTAVAGRGEATVSWDPPADTGGSAIVSYEVTSSPGGLTCTTTSDTSCTVTGLTNGVTYTFTVTATNALGESLPSEPSNAVTPQAVYYPLTPARLLDTRTTGETTDGLEEGGGAIAANTSISFQVAGRGGVPATGVGAVVLNLTGTQGTAGTYLTAYAAGTTRPSTSNLNLGPSATESNLVVVPVGADGKVSIYNAAGSQQVIADVQGWFPSGGDYTAVTPGRVVDTRTTGGPITAGQSRTLQVTGSNGIPATGVGAVVLNVTATAGTAPTFLTVYPTGSTRPTASNLNVGVDQTIANLVVAKVGDDGSVDVYNQNGSQHVVVDVFGWLPAADSYVGLTPYRALDTRSTAAVGPGGTVDVTVTGVGGVPASGVDAVVVNITATAGTAGTFITAYPTGETRPATSNLPVAPDETVPNAAIVKVGEGGKITLYNQLGNQHIIVDVQGYFPSS